MPSTDSVPCFYTGQQDFERPAKTLSRGDCRQLKALQLGKFENHGASFRFFEAVADRPHPFFDGPIGIGNVLPFAKAHNYGDKLHYSTPMAGDVGMRRYGLYSQKVCEGKISLNTKTRSLSRRTSPEIKAAWLVPGPSWTPQMVSA